MRNLLRRWRNDIRDLRRYVSGAYIDLRLALTGKTERDLPPLRLRDVGGGDFRKIGDGLLRVLIAHGLRPTDRVLDIGCGIGRVAIPLTQYLRDGSYEGFDVVKSWIRWCRSHITPRHPSFRFRHASIYNSHYNRRGIPAAEFRFPYKDDAFDFVFATSVFTHLDIRAASNYLRESARVLRPGGTLLATFFVSNGAPDERGMHFTIDCGEYKLVDSENPDAAIAFTERWVRREISDEVWESSSIVPGAWRLGDSASFQDVVVARKRCAALDHQPHDPADARHL